MRLSLSLALIPALLTGVVGCGGGNEPLPFGVSADHVVVVALENHGFSQVIGSPAMPYLNTLASRYALAANYFAVTHPSIGNYFALTVGRVVTNNTNFSGSVSDDNIVTALEAARKTWRGYYESIPSQGYVGPTVYPYHKNLNPFAYLNVVLDSPGARANIVPLTQLSADLQSGWLPNFALIVPDLEHNAHDCPGGGTACPDSDRLTAADNWLTANIDPVINSPLFGNGVLVVLWDEANLTDLEHGGGHVAVVLAGAKVKPGFVSTTFYQHESILRLALGLLGVNDLPNGARFARSMREFFL